jgi:hypothetical protein
LNNCADAGPGARSWDQTFLQVFLRIVDALLDRVLQELCSGFLGALGRGRSADAREPRTDGCLGYTGPQQAAEQTAQRNGYRNFGQTDTKAAERGQIAFILRSIPSTRPLTCFTCTCAATESGTCGDTCRTERCQRKERRCGAKTFAQRTADHAFTANGNGELISGTCPQTADTLTHRCFKPLRKQSGRTQCGALAKPYRPAGDTPEKLTDLRTDTGAGEQVFAETLLVLPGKCNLALPQSGINTLLFVYCRRVPRNPETIVFPAERARNEDFRHVNSLRR